MTRFMTSDSFSYTSPIGDVWYDCNSQVAHILDENEQNVKLLPAQAAIVNAICANTFEMAIVIEDQTEPLANRFAADVVFDGCLSLCEKIINVALMGLV